MAFDLVALILAGVCGIMAVALASHLGKSGVRQGSMSKVLLAMAITVAGMVGFAFGFLEGLGIRQEVIGWLFSQV